MNKIYRIITTLAGVFVGISVINGLTYVGNQSKGPLEDIFIKMGMLVSDAEGYLMNGKNERTKKMEWLSQYRRDTEQLRSPRHFLFGAFDNQSKTDFESALELENALQTTFPILHIYTAWGDRSDQRFPLTEVSAIHELGSIPMVTWEPWLVDFDKETHPHIAPKDVRAKGGLKAIASGHYDFYLQKWIKDLHQFDRPLFLRWGHEMNDPYRYSWGPQNNPPEDFVKAWKYVVDFFRKEGVNNVLWVWSPHIAYGHFDAYYPGHDYVDWIGVGTLNYGSVASWSDWWTFDEIFGKHYATLDNFNKPIMISEFGSLAVGGNRIQWYEDAICGLPEKYPNVKSLLYFHFNKDNTLT